MSDERGIRELVEEAVRVGQYPRHASSAVRDQCLNCGAPVGPVGFGGKWMHVEGDHTWRYCESSPTRQPAEWRHAMTSDENPADTVTEQAARVINRWLLLGRSGHAIAQDLDGHHLLADPADRDDPVRADIVLSPAEQIEAVLRRAGRAEAEVARLNDALTARSAALNARIDSAEKISKDVMRERDELRATVDRVRDVAADCERITGARTIGRALQNALDGGGQQ